MNDILPAESGNWQYFESICQKVLDNYCYQEIRFPILEETQLFARSVGAVTDIVEKEMYTFLDRNQESVTLRPEGTAGCVRAADQHGLLYNQVQRLYYSGPMFRYERPQKGRMRQFHQVGVEAFGIATEDIELELILLSAQIFRELGLLGKLRLEINSIGDSDARSAFGEALVGYLSSHKDKLDEDSQKRMDSNPMRILDSKDPNTQALLQDAPKLAHFLSEPSTKRFEAVKQSLEDLQIEFIENPALVRGLDYYNDLVFEWTTEHLGAQATVCAGGRYDGLVEKLGGKATPAVGFAIGKERLILLLEELGLLPEQQEPCDVFIAYIGQNNSSFAVSVAEQVRRANPAYKVLLNCGASSLKSQMKKANKSRAEYALVLADNAREANQVELRYLRDEREPRLLNIADLLAELP